MNRRIWNSRRFLRKLLRYPSLLVGGAILVAYLCMVVFAPQLAPQGPDDQDLFSVLLPPSGAHPFGTDPLGRDVLSRVIYGARYTLLITFVSITIAALIGVPAGLFAAYRGKKLEAVIMRVVDFTLTFPTLLLAILVVAILGIGIRGLILAIAVSFFPRIARLAYSVTLPVRENEFIIAAHAMGASDLRIVIRHVLPNVAGPILVEVSLRAGQAVLTAAALGFLGLGVTPPTPEWGAMISRGKDYLSVAPHIVIATGSAISLSVLGFNLLADGLRDMLDPRMSRQRGGFG